MHWLGWVVLFLALVEGGWMAFDGAHALVTGDFVTPKTGQFAGQYGPWSKVISAVGVDPHSNIMKWVFLLFGSAWIVVMVCFALKLKWAWFGMLLFAIGGLWYLPWGLLLGVIQIVLLLLPALRDG